MSSKTDEKYKMYIEHDPTILRVMPKLAEEIGLNESMMLLQLNFWIDNSDNLEEGRYWTYQSIREMKEKAFSFWSKDTINRTIKRLEEKDLIVVDNFNKSKYDKTRWFAINWEEVEKLNSTVVIETEGVSQDETGVSQNETRSAQNETTIPETTSETTPRDVKDEVSDVKSEDDQPKYSEDSKPFQLALKLRQLIRKNFPHKSLKEPTTEGLEDWADSIRKMEEYGENANDDGKPFTFDEIEELIEFSQNDEFWRSNILSASRLREKGAQLMDKMQKKNNGKKKKKEKTPKEPEKNWDKIIRDAGGIPGS